MAGSGGGGEGAAPAWAQPASTHEPRATAGCSQWAGTRGTLQSTSSAAPTTGGTSSVGHSSQSAGLQGLAGGQVMFSRKGGQHFSASPQNHDCRKIFLEKIQKKLLFLLFVHGPRQGGLAHPPTYPPGDLSSQKKTPLNPGSETK